MEIDRASALADVDAVTVGIRAERDLFDALSLAQPSHKAAIDRMFNRRATSADTATIAAAIEALRSSTQRRSVDVALRVSELFALRDQADALNATRAMLERTRLEGPQRFASSPRRSVPDAGGSSAVRRPPCPRSRISQQATRAPRIPPLIQGGSGMDGPTETGDVLCGGADGYVASGLPRSRKPTGSFIAHRQTRARSVQSGMITPVRHAGPVAPDCGAERTRLKDPSDNRVTARYDIGTFPR